MMCEVTHMEPISSVDPALIEEASRSAGAQKAAG